MAHPNSFYLYTVQEFREAVGEKPVSDLRHSLKLDIRCGPGSTEQEQQSAVALIALLTNTYPQFSDWKELVKSAGHADVQKCMEKNTDLTKAETMPDMGGVILAPEGMVFYFTNSLVRKYLKHRLNKSQYF